MFSDFWELTKSIHGQVPWDSDITERSQAFLAVVVLSFVFLLWPALQAQQSKNAALTTEYVKPCDGKAGLSRCPEATKISPQSIAASAEECWAGQFGHLKHCGLRPNPLDGSRKPEYSLKPLELPLPELSTEEAAGLRELGQRVSDMSGKHRTDPATLLRYLRARKCNVDQTEKYFREAARWRMERGCYEALSTWNLQAYEECLAPWWLSGGFFGHGKKGEMIAYERASACNFPELIKRMPWEELEKLDIVHCMRSLAAIEEDSMLRGIWMGNGILIEDCEGFGFDQVNFHATRKFNQLIENRNQIMPECLTKILVIRAPAAFVYAWKMFSYLLDPGIREKVQVAGTSGEETLRLLQRFINDDEIPAYLGGKKHINGDPQCRKVLAPGGNMPEEALQRFLRLRAERPTEQGDPDAKSMQQKIFLGWAACILGEEDEDDLNSDKSARGCCG